MINPERDWARALIAGCTPDQVRALYNELQRLRMNEHNKDPERKKRNAERSAEWYKANPEKVAGYVANRRASPRGYDAEYAKRYYAEHKEEINQRSNEYYARKKAEQKAKEQNDQLA